MKVRHIDFSPDEWIGGTVALSNADRGLYITACAMIYSHGGAIKIDDLFATCTDHATALKNQLNRLIASGKLIVKGSQITNKRCENELRNARKRSIKGRQNVAKRWKNNGLEPPGVLPRSTPNHQPSTINHQPLRMDASRPMRARDPDGWTEWYAEYPHKVGKRAAAKAYQSALARASPAEILAGTRNYIAGKPPDRQWCNPATFLTQDRWLDEPATQPEQRVDGNAANRQRSPVENLYLGAMRAADKFDQLDRQQADRGADLSPPFPLLDSRRPA